MNALRWQSLLTSPGEVARVGALVLAVLALLYLLRPQRRRVEVPFGGLWQRVLAQSEERSVGRHVRRLLSFLLMAALAALLVAALAEPLLAHRTEGRGTPPPRPHTVVIVDVSASMQTHTVGEATRLSEAQEALRAWLAQAPAEEEFLLLAASGHAEVMSGWGSDRQALDAAVVHLQATDGGLDLPRALATAEQALQHRSLPRMVLVSDGGPSELPLTATPTTLLEHIRVGPAAAWRPVPQPASAAVANGTLTNAAVVALRARPDPRDPGRGTLTVWLRNDGAAAMPVQLRLHASDVAVDAASFATADALQRLVELTLAPGLSQHVVPDVDLTAARFAVHVRPVGALPDAAPWDDWGFAVLGEKREISVLLVTGAPGVDPHGGNLYLDAALFAHGQVKRQYLAAADYRPDQFAAKDRARHGVDVVVLDQAGHALPDGTPGLILSLAAGPTETLRLAEGPELAVRAEDHPAMRGISFVDTNFDKVRLLTARAGDTVLAVARPRGAVMVARQSGARSLEWGIDLLETDLGARYALPLLVSNGLLWLTGGDEALVPPLPVGRPWAIEAPVDAAWQVEEPGQPARAARTSGRQLLGQSERHGIHIWRASSGRVVARATVLAASENPALSAPWGPPARVLSPSHAAQLPSHSLPRWGACLLAALLVLALEWLGYLRRRTV